jgi:DUF438 domain-containing protein
MEEIMPSGQWDEMLIEEHAMIERATDVFRREIDKMPGKTPDQFALQRAVDFLLEFGDRIHNQKEEKILFPMMVERGIPADGPIRVMLSEHERERQNLLQFFSEIPYLDSRTHKERLKLKQTAQDYMEMRAHHIWKENDVLFKMGRQVLTNADNQRLVDAFTAKNQTIYGDRAEENLRQMLEEVEKGMRARTSLIHNLSINQIDAIFETLPMEVTFVDADDMVMYFNRLDKEKIFLRSRSVVGRRVQQCHPSKSVDQVQRIVDGFKDGSMDSAEFWIDLKGDKILIRYLPVHDEAGQYMGILEVTQAIGALQEITGEKRLL